MPRINSRKKGCKAERDASKSFETWTNKKFARTPSSGGLNWKSSNAKGDIVCTTEGHYFPFCIEVKSYKEINLSYLLVGKKDCIMYKFWEQCSGDAKKANKTPLLLMRFNGMPKFEWVVVMELTLFKLLEKSNSDKWLNSSNFLFSVKDGLVLMNSAQFFTSDYKAIKKLLKPKK